MAVAVSAVAAAAGAVAVSAVSALAAGAVAVTIFWKAWICGFSGFPVFWEFCIFGVLYCVEGSLPRKSLGFVPESSGTRRCDFRVVLVQYFH